MSPFYFNLKTTKQSTPSISISVKLLISVTMELYCISYISSESEERYMLGSKVSSEIVNNVLSLKAAVLPKYGIKVKNSVTFFILKKTSKIALTSIISYLYILVM